MIQSESESIFLELDAFEPARIKHQLRFIPRVEAKIEYVKDMLNKVTEELYKTGQQIEDFDKNPISDDKKATQFVSLINYKFLLLRNSKFALLEELVDLQDGYIAELTKEAGSRSW